MTTVVVVVEALTWFERKKKNETWQTMFEIGVGNIAP